MKDSFKDFEASDRYFALYGVRKAWARTEHIPNGYYEPPRMNWKPALEEDAGWPSYRWAVILRKFDPEWNWKRYDT